MIEKIPDEEKYPNRWAHFGRLYDDGGKLPSGMAEVKNTSDQPEYMLRDGRGLSGIEL